MAYKHSPPSSRKGSVAGGKKPKCEALFDFDGASPEDLRFKKGDILTVKSMTEDPNWWLAVNQKGEGGMIPANYVELLPEGGGTVQRSATLPRDASGNVLPMPWFHGKISRETAEELLSKHGKKDGLYMIRESTNFPGDYTLCVCFEGNVDHYRIQTIDGRLTIDEEEFFDDLERLIAHYKKDPDGLSTHLVEPLMKRGGAEFIDKKKFKVGGWEIDPKYLTKDHLLGSGQFGEVYEGTYKDTKVAIKTLKNTTEASVREFLAEAHVMTQMKHQNLVLLIGVCTKSPVMIVSEFMAKGCMLDYLRSRGRSVITAAVQLGFVKDICAAMTYLEEKNFVHRDLAARNILLSADCVAKVSDFGLAKDSRLGSIDLGKLPIKWTAPEALRQKVSTSKSDVWSYGVVIWEIYSFGRAPYPRMSQKEVVEKVAKGYRMEKPETCPKDLYEKVMKWCWLIDAKDRPSFKQLSAKLKKFTVAT
eukprot:m.45098 g.45098  ORF g.45098 m.45098 type:complete len:475 (+) comp10191_c0_seq1:295-1719(+)